MMPINCPTYRWIIIITDFVLIIIYVQEYIEHIAGLSYFCHMFLRANSKHGSFDLLFILLCLFVIIVIIDIYYSLERVLSNNLELSINR